MIRRLFSSITRARSRINFCPAPPRCSRRRSALGRLRSRTFAPCARWVYGPRPGSSWRGSVASPCFRRCSRCCAPRCAPSKSRPESGFQVSAGRWFAGFVAQRAPASRRYRWPLVGGAVVLMLCGAAALFGIPGVFAPIALEMDVLTYVNPSERVAQDTRQFEQSNGLDVVELWLQTPPGHALDPDFLRALEQLTRRLESDPRITAVDGPTSVLRWARYIETGSDQLPTQASAWPKLASDLEQIMLTEPGARKYVDVTNLADARLSIRGRAKLFGRVGAMRTFVAREWG